MTDQATRNPGQQAKPGQQMPGQQNQRDAAGAQHQPNQHQGKPGEQNQKNLMGGSRDQQSGGQQSGGQQSGGQQSGGQSRGGFADQNPRAGEHGRG